MAFNSLPFLLFLPTVFLLYWLVFGKNAKTQNLLLLLASITFYCIADWKFFFLLIASGFLNFYLAQYISIKAEGKTRKLLFYSGIVFNVGILFYFKYFNFFIQSFVTLFNYSGTNFNFTPFHILLPLGISFFTFQMIGYLIDVNNEEITPTNNLLNFLTYLFYFPKILSGPIERVQGFLPQIEKRREFDPDLVINGLRQILWGLFKKMVIADNCIYVAEKIFTKYQGLSGSTLLIGAIFYMIHLYTDFSGYSDIACGVSKLFNIRIINNFAFPFFSTNISEFWKKWHISLTSWLMDYVFTPMSFILRQYNKMGLIVSILLTFFLVGLWHGANWSYILYGIMHGLYFIPLIFLGSMNKSKEIAREKQMPSLREILSMSGLFVLVSITGVFFWTENIGQAFNYIQGIFSTSLISLPSWNGREYAYPLIVIVILFFTIEWIGRNNEYAIEKFGINWKRTYRWALYAFVIFLIGMFLRTEEAPFVYLQF